MWTNLIPMAGTSKRFTDQGYRIPKPFLPVGGKPMIQLVWENLPPADRWVFVIRAEHEEFLKTIFQSSAPRNEVIVHTLPTRTDGAACTVLSAESHVDPASSLLIADCDQWIDWSPSHFAEFCYRSFADGVIGTFRGTKPSYSYAQIRDDGRITCVAEKQPISPDAVSGIFYWRESSRAFHCLRQMWNKGLTTQGEYYVCPAYNELIEEGGTVLAYPLPRLWSMGTPDDYIKVATADRSGLDRFCGQVIR